MHCTKEEYILPLMDSCMSHCMACFLVLEEMRELNKCDRFVVCGVFVLCVDQVDS